MKNAYSNDSLEQPRRLQLSTPPLLKHAELACIDVILDAR